MGLTPTSIRERGREERGERGEGKSPPTEEQGEEGEEGEAGRQVENATKERVKWQVVPFSTSEFVIPSALPGVGAPANAPGPVSSTQARPGALFEPVTAYKCMRLPVMRHQKQPEKRRKAGHSPQDNDETAV